MIFNCVSHEFGLITIFTNNRRQNWNCRFKQINSFKIDVNLRFIFRDNLILSAKPTDHIYELWIILKLYLINPKELLTRHPKLPHIHRGLNSLSISKSSLLFRHYISSKCFKLPMINIIILNVSWYLQEELEWFRVVY